MKNLNKLRGLKTNKSKQDNGLVEPLSGDKSKKKHEFDSAEAIPKSTIKKCGKNIDEILEDLEIKGKVTKFVKEFVIDFKPEQAAKRAGYKSPKHGFALIKKDEVLNAIRALLDINNADELVSAPMLRGQMALYAQSNIADYFDSDGTFKGFDAIPTSKASCIQSFHKKFDKEGRPEFKITLYDAMKANELMGRVHQIYEKPNEDPKEFDDMSIDEILDYLSAFMPEDAIEKLRGEV